MEGRGRTFAFPVFFLTQPGSGGAFKSSGIFWAVEIASGESCGFAADIKLQEG